MDIVVLLYFILYTISIIDFTILIIITNASHTFKNFSNNIMSTIIDFMILNSAAALLAAADF